MQINGQLVFNNRNNSFRTKLFKLPIKKVNIQSRNINNSNNNSLINSTNIQKGSLYSTKEATPRKEHNKLNDPLDDSLSQITDILNSGKKPLNYADLVGKIPGISNEPNIIYDQILYNKNKINKAKKLAQKIGVLKLPIKNINMNNIYYNDTLSNSDRNKQNFSKKIKGTLSSNKKEKKSQDDNAEVSCCFFGRK